MYTYQMAEVELRGGSIGFWCTDEQEAKDVLEEVRQDLWIERKGDRRFTGRIKTMIPIGKGWEGSKVFAWHFDKIAIQSDYVVWRLFQELCSRGWEPLGRGRSAERFPWYLFRKTITP